MPLEKRIVHLGQSLVQEGILDRDQLDSVLSTTEQWGTRIGRVLVEKRLAKEHDVVAAIAKIARVSEVDLAKHPPAPQALTLIDVATCEAKGLVPVALADQERSLVIAMADPTDLGTVDALVQKIRRRIRVMVAPESIIQKAIRRGYYGEEVSLEPEAEEELISEIDEIKLVDVSGRTLMVADAVVSLKDALAKAKEETARQQEAAAAPPKPPAPRPPPAPARPPAPRQPTAPPPPRAPTPAADPAALIAQLQQQVAHMAQAQEWTQKVGKNVVDMLIEQKMVSPEELRRRLGRK